MSSTRDFQNINVSATANIELLELQDTASDNIYIFGVNELAADRTVTLPLLTGNDTFVFEAFTQILTNKTLTSPIIAPDILDASGAELIVFAPDATPVNEITIANADTGVSPSIIASGVNTDVGLNIITKGSGTLVLNGGAALTWPVADGSANQVIATNGAGTLSFATAQVATINTVQTTTVATTTIATIGTTTDSTHFIDVKLVAHDQADVQGAGYLLRATFLNDTGTVTQIGTDDKLSFESDTAWNVATLISTTNVLIQVTGEAATTIDWRSLHSVTTVT